MLIMGIETTCDETSVAIVKDGKEVLSNIVSSQIKEHLLWKGVVPEIASRLHLEKIIPIMEKALKKAKVKLNNLDLIAVANRPGLIGGLLIGVSIAKSIAWALDKPVIGINHVEAHLYSPHLEKEIKFPYIGLLVSGGHTLIIYAENFTQYNVLGTTIDDAVGEAFDKIAKFYNLGYPGGPAVEKAAENGDEKAFDFPLSHLYKTDKIYDVSYSGLKTAVIHHLSKFQKKEKYTINDIAASFQKRAFDMLIKKTLLACKNYKINRIVVAGGVAANKYLRKRFMSLENYEVYFPDIKYSTDNAAMIAGYAYYKYKEQGEDGLTLSAFSRVIGYKSFLKR